MKQENTYTVNVGNIGNIGSLYFDNEIEAREAYSEHVQNSKDGYGREAGEDVWGRLCQGATGKAPTQYQDMGGFPRGMELA